jgi:hypothetical protein
VAKMNSTTENVVDSCFAFRKSIVQTTVPRQRDVASSERDLKPLAVYITGPAWIVPSCPLSVAEVPLANKGREKGRSLRGMRAGKNVESSYTKSRSRVGLGTPPSHDV